jgi:hypothetical protein
VRLQVADRFGVDLQMAKPLTRDGTINYGQYHARPWRMFTSVQAQF